MASFEYKGKMLNRKELNLIRLDEGSNKIHGVEMNDLFGGTDASGMPRCVGAMGAEECAKLGAVVEATYLRWESDMRTEDEISIRKWQSRPRVDKMLMDLDQSAHPTPFVQRLIPGYFIIAIIENGAGGFE